MHCFQDSCLYSILQDYVTAGGVCKDTPWTTNGPPNFEPYPAAYPTSTNPVCTTSLLFSGQCPSLQYMQDFPCEFYEITSGVCSTSTETKLATTTCQNELAYQPGFIYTTLNSLILDMCTYANIPAALGGSGKRKKRSEERTPKNLFFERFGERDFLKSLGKPSPVVRKQDNATSRLAPIGLVTTSSGSVLSTDLNFGETVEFIS